MNIKWNALQWIVYIALVIIFVSFYVYVLKYALEFLKETDSIFSLKGVIGLFIAMSIYIHIYKMLHFTMKKINLE